MTGGNGLMPEQFLIVHCSPTLAGLKIANMFPVSPDAGLGGKMPRSRRRTGFRQRDFQ